MPTAFMPAALTAWLLAHHTQIVYTSGAALAVLNTALKIALWLHPIPDWVMLAEKNPRVAALGRLMGALGIQPVAALQAFVDFVRGKASPGTLAAAQAFKVSASKPLIAPASPPKVIVEPSPSPEKLP